MTTAVVTIVMFLVMISIHEFGHFIVSKLCGVRVIEFAIGMGPAIFKKSKGDTLYSIRILPIGGFCRLEGEENQSDDEKAFCNQAAWKRLLIIIAGAVLNIVLGYIVFLLIVSRSQSYSTNIIGSLEPNAYFEQAGARVGDTIVEINGHSISFYPEIDLYSRDFKAGEHAQIVVKRDNERIKLDVPLSSYTITQTYLDDGILSVVDINGVKTEEKIPYSDKVIKDTSKLGQSFNYESVKMGFTPYVQKTTPLGVLKEAFSYTKYVVKLVYKSFFDLIIGKVGINQMSGPVGIVSSVNTAVKSGTYWVENTLTLIGILTINLGVFNLFPIPALDGGRLVFIIIEIIRRKPIPVDKEAIVHAVGFMLIMLLAVCVTIFDVMRLINH